MKRLVSLVFVALVLMGALESPAFAGTVKGTVTPVQWAQEVEVCAIGPQVSERCAAPKADGSYVYSGIQGTVTFEFLPTYRSDLLTQYYDHKQALAEARYIEVGPGVVEGVDADLLEGGSITGVVTAEAGGARLPEVEVCATSISPPTLKSCGETDANGEYSLHSLPGGLYKVGFWGQAGSAEYEPTYYQEKASLSQATSVVVAAGQSTAGIGAALIRGGQIGGQVLAVESGMPLDDIAVCLFSGTEATPRRCVFSGVDGAYSFQGLPSGSYQVGYSLEGAETGGTGTTAGADDFRSQYYDEVSARARAATISLLGPGTVEGVDAHLSRLPVVSPPAVPPVVGTSSSAPIVVVPELKPEVPRCKKPRHKAKVAGKVRCVRPTKHQKPKAPSKPEKSEHR